MVLPIDFDKLDESVQNMISQLEIDVMDLKREALFWRLASMATVILVAERLTRPARDTVWLIAGFAAMLALWWAYRKYRSWSIRQSVRRVYELINTNSPIDRT